MAYIHRVFVQDFFVSHLGSQRRVSRGRTECNWDTCPCKESPEAQTSSADTYGHIQIQAFLWKPCCTSRPHNHAGFCRLAVAHLASQLSPPCDCPASQSRPARGKEDPTLRLRRDSGDLPIRAIHSPNINHPGNMKYQQLYMEVLYSQVIN